MISGLLKRSANQPPSIEKRMKGAANRAPASATRVSRSSTGSALPRTSRITRFFSALSLKAVWNWVTIRHQKPRRQPGTPCSRVSLMGPSQPARSGTANLLATPQARRAAKSSNADSARLRMYTW